MQPVNKTTYYFHVSILYSAVLSFLIITFALIVQYHLSDRVKRIKEHNVKQVCFWLTCYEIKSLNACFILSITGQ